MERLPSEPLIIDEDKLDPIKCFGYSRSKPLTILCCVLCVLSMGFLPLILYWKPNWRLKMMWRKCSLHQADTVLITDMYQREHVKHIQRVKVTDKCESDLNSMLKKDVILNNELRFFCYQKMKFIWDQENYSFFVPRSPELSEPCGKVFNGQQAGLSQLDVVGRQTIFGLNKISVDVKPIFVMFVQEALNPFYVFQIYSITIWMLFEYWSFSICIIVMTLFSLSVSLYVTRKESIKLQKMVESNLKLQVLRPDGSTVTETEDQLVPGDVLVIPANGCMMTCDAVLINGTCIVNESMLTGESVPETKVSISSQQTSEDAHRIYSDETDKRHTLFCGTQVIQTRPSGSDVTKAVVIQTAFSTMKGSLVRSILYPRPMEFKLYRDAMMFVGSYIILAFIGVIYSIWVLVISGLGTKLTILLTLDSITIAIQPLLPVALTIGMVYAQLRLKKQNIFCISPQRINLCGVLDVVCFDKTGTLTEDGLDLLGIRRIADNSFISMETTVSALLHCDLLNAMATCHSLAIIDGEINGDPMDLKMFQATGWTLEESEVNDGRGQVTYIKPPNNGDTDMSALTILKQFTFSSSLQRMSVIVQAQTTNKLTAYVKGSPEKIRALATPSSVPEDFSAILDSYTAEGFRVLAIACKPLDDVSDQDYHKLSRDAIESDLTFIGLLIWQNKLKPESLPVITELRESNIRTIMVTGDNILTAISVAGKCGMIGPSDTVIKVTAPSDDEKQKELIFTRITRDHNSNNTTDVDTGIDNCSTSLIHKTSRIHYALDGVTFASIQERFPQSLPSIIVRGTIFARMLPNQKQSLIEALQELEYCVGMCGDGANDCGALKTAHAGISLSEAEASVASPFTSKIANVTCVPKLIKEGRSALVTSFGLFKYIALYTFIMYVTANIAKKFGSYPSGPMFTIWDIGMASTIVLLMGRSGPYEKIANQKPPTRLLRAPNMFSLLIHIIVLAISQVVVVFMVQAQGWYEEKIRTAPDDIEGPSFETTAVFYVANFQFVIYGILFTPGRPFRAPLWSNPLYLTDLVILTLFCILVLLVPLPRLESFLGCKHIPEYKFRVILLAVSLFNCVVSYLFEFVVVPLKFVQKVLSCWKNEKLPKFKLVEMESTPDKMVSHKEHDESCV